jgi:hypothetical protein
MMPARRGFAEHPLFVGLLLAALAAQAFFSSRIKTATFDEPAHIGAGLSYLKTGDFKVNLQHPPLLKELAALPLVLIGARFPVPPDVWDDVTTPPQGHFQWVLGDEVLFQNGADRVLFWSRLPFLGLTLLLGWLLFRWGRRLVGGTAAASGLLLFALDPTIVAHGPLVTTDVGFAALGLLFLYALWHYLNHRSARRLLWCGLALGAALATKFSALLLLPVAAVLVFWAGRWIPASVPLRPSTLADPYASGDTAQRAVWSLYALLAMVALAAVVIHVLYFFPRNPFLYLKGLQLVNADHDPTYWPYMAGELRPRFPSYYLLAYLLKEPVPHVLLAAIGLWALLRRGASTTMDRAFLILPPAALFLAYSLLSHNLGFRYVIPALPFLHLVGGAGLASLAGDGPAWKKILAAALCAWMVLAAAGIYPDHLSYFNELACLLVEPGRLGLDGGTRCGPLWLDDSNVDWGQGLKQLRAWLQRHAAGRTARMAYFGSIRPTRYGLDHTLVSVDTLVRPPLPGLYVVSAHFIGRTLGRLSQEPGRGAGHWLRSVRPVAVVGHAYYVYDFPETGAD